MHRIWRWKRDLNPCRGICSPLPRLSAIPPKLANRLDLSNFTSNIIGTNWSGRRGSNPRPEPWQGSALPTALRPHFLTKFREGAFIEGENLSHGL